MKYAEGLKDLLNVLILTPTTLGSKANLLFLGFSKHPALFHLPDLGGCCRLVSFRSADFRPPGSAVPPSGRKARSMLGAPKRSAGLGSLDPLRKAALLAARPEAAGWAGSCLVSPSQSPSRAFLVSLEAHA